MDFSIGDNEWIVDTNTEKLNTELFGDVNVSHKTKRSRRRKRKVKTASQNTVKKNSQVSLESNKSPERSVNKDDSWTHNFKKRKRKFKTSISENSVDCIKNFEHKERYNYQEYKKLDSPAADSSELFSKSFSKLKHHNKLKKGRGAKKFHKQIFKNDTINLSPKKKCNMENEISQPVSELDGNSSKINCTNSSMTQKKRKGKKKNKNFVQKSLQSSISSDHQSSLQRLSNSSNCSTTLNITKLKDILKSAEFSQTAGLKLETKDRKKGMLILEKGKRKEYSDIVRKQAIDKLKSARFRFINEKMYTVTGKESMHLFKLDPDAFKIYHDGYQAQVDKWPLNPVDIIIDDIDKKPKTLKIADFGCGNARIAQAFPDRKVHSFDFISMNNYVTVCDMANVPLTRDSIDIVVFCLALMGTNLKDYLSEAHRVLKMGGQLKIAEVVSRIENPDTFIDDLKKFGFTLSEKNVSHKMFIFFDFSKTGKFDWTKLPAIELKPCLYKKR